MPPRFELGAPLGTPLSYLPPRASPPRQVDHRSDTTRSARRVDLLRSPFLKSAPCQIFAAHNLLNRAPSPRSATVPPSLDTIS